MSEEHRTDTECSFRELVKRIAARIRPVCAHIPEAEFRSLVERMASVEQKYIHYPNPVPPSLRGNEDIW